LKHPVLIPFDTGSLPLNNGSNLLQLVHASIQNVTLPSRISTLITWTFSRCWWFWWWWWRQQMWGWYIPGATQYAIVPVLCAPLSFSFGANLVTQTM